MLLFPYYQEITCFQVLSAIVGERQYVLSSSGDVTSVNEISLTILVITSCVSGIVDAIGLLLGVCRLYSVDGVSTCEME